MFVWHPSQIFLACCGGVVSGIVGASFAGDSEALWLASFLLVTGICAVLILARQKPRMFLGQVLLLVIFCVGAVVGFWRGYGIFTENAHTAAHVRESSSLGGKTATIEADIVANPEMGMRSQKLVVVPAEDSLLPEYEIVRDKKILIITPRYPSYAYGERLHLEGKLVVPEKLENFDYAAFLAKDDIFLTMAFPVIEKVSSGHGLAVFEVLFRVKRALTKGIFDSMRAEEAGILLAVLTGDEGGMSKAFIEDLNRSGLRHIVAVSGMNITIIANVIMAALLFIMPRRGAFGLAFLCVVLFVLFVGAPASAVRAGIMGVLLLFAQSIGRLSSASSALVGAGALMGFMNPLALRFDLGFQLSFLAMFGIILFSEKLFERMSFIPDTLEARRVMAMTVSAQILTAPLLISAFGQFSIFGIASNLLVVPMLSLLTIFGFLTGFFGILFGADLIARIFAFPILLLLQWISFVAETFGALPLAYIRAGEAVSMVLLGLYGLIVFFLWRSLSKSLLRQNPMPDHT